MNAVMKTAAALAAAMCASLSLAGAAETPANGLSMADMSALSAKIRNFTEASHQRFTQVVVGSAEMRVRAKIDNAGYRKPAAPFQMAANFLPEEF